MYKFYEMHRLQFSIQAYNVPISVVIAVEDVMQTDVSEEKVAFFGRTYQVVLKLSHGASVGLTESFTFGSSRLDTNTVTQFHLLFLLFFSSLFFKFTIKFKA